jgi:hypothetical protein
MPSDFLIKFHQQHFDESVPIYSREVFYKLLCKIEELRRREDDAEEQ